MRLLVCTTATTTTTTHSDGRVCYCTGFATDTANYDSPVIPYPDWEKWGTNMKWEHDKGVIGYYGEGELDSMYVAR